MSFDSPPIVVHSSGRNFELKSGVRYDSTKDDGHGHGHGHGNKTEKHGHGHGHGNKKEKHGHGHGHGNKKEKHGGHGHSHSSKKEKHGGHGHSHSSKKEKHGGHGHSHSSKKDKHNDDDEFMDEYNEDVRLLIASSPGSSRPRKRKLRCDRKTFSFWYVGIMTLVYCIAELAAGGAFSSLTLMSDGFHNLSDVVSLVIANWAAQAAKRPQSDEMSFGWARTELLGGLINGTFLLALCLYTGLEAIFRFVYPEPVGNVDIFIIVAASGVAVNLIGTLVFCLTGEGGHSHAGGGDHGHSHGGHGHSHGGGSHSDDDDNDDDDDDEHDHHDDHGDHHGHSHGGGHGHGAHGGKKKKKKQRDENVYAVFLHYLGDFVSSILVLITGILIKSFDGATWTHYLDPIASLLIVGLILYTTLPLVQRCSWILLQSAPKSISTDLLKTDLLNIDGVLSVHDLHIWQLVDGMVMCSSHVHIEEGLDWTFVSASIREALHKHGIHSSAMQPEFVPASVTVTPYCAQNCVEECEEDWCCKKPAEEAKADELFLQNSYGSAGH